VPGLVGVVFVYKSSLNMVTPLPNCTTVEQRAVVLCLWSEGIKRSEIYRRMLSQYCENCTAQRNTYKVVGKFKRGRTTPDHINQSDQPSTSQTEDHRAEVYSLIEENRRIIVHETAPNVSIFYG
jgi:hypothetical protein